MKFFLGIGFKLVLTSVLLGGLMAVGLVLTLIKYQEAFLEKIYSSQAITLANSFDAGLTREDLADPSKLQNKIYKFMYLSSEVKEINLDLQTEKGLVVVASSDVAQIGSKVLENPAKIATVKSKTGKDLLVVTSPIKVSGEEVGSYEIAFSTDLAQKSRSELLRGLVLVVFLFGAVAIVIFGLAFKYFLLMPIDKLVSGAEELGKGNLQFKVKVFSNDELGRLARTFNEMAQKLQKQYADLELLVAQRTADLQLNQQFLKETQAIANFGSYELDFKTGFWKSSEILDRIFGIDQKFTRSVEGWLSLIHPGDRKMMADYYKDHVANGEHHFDKEYRIVRVSDGGEAWVHGLGKVTLDKKNQPLTMIGTIQDITDKKQTELSLIKENDQIKQYIDSAGVIIVAINSAKQVTLINRKGAEVLGLPEKDIVGKNWFETFVPVAIRLEVEKQFARLIKGDLTDLDYYENPILTAKGEERLIGWHNSFLKDASGKIIASISSGDDITKKKEQEQILKKMNDLMVDRELKMVELKKQLAAKK